MATPNNLLKGHPEGLAKHINIRPFEDMAFVDIQKDIESYYEIDYIPFFATHKDIRYYIVLSSDLVHDVPENPSVDWCVGKINELSFYTSQIWEYLKWDKEDVTIHIPGVPHVITAVHIDYDVPVHSLPSTLTRLSVYECSMAQLIALSDNVDTIQITTNILEDFQGCFDDILPNYEKAVSETVGGDNDGGLWNITLVEETDPFEIEVLCLTVADVVGGEVMFKAICHSDSHIEKLLRKAINFK